MLEGMAEIWVDGLKAATTIGRGETALLPAGMQNAWVRTVKDCVWLEVTFGVGGSGRGG
jgi:hypothetical protein